LGGDGAHSGTSPRPRHPGPRRLLRVPRLSHPRGALHTGERRPMASTTARTGLTRARGSLSFPDKKGNVRRPPMARGGGKASKAKPQVVAKVGVKREDGFLYFIDKDGDVAKTKMAKPGARRSARRGRKAAAPRKSARRARKPAARRATRRARR